MNWLRKIIGKKESEWDKFLRLGDKDIQKTFAPIVRSFFIPDRINGAKFSANWHEVLYTNFFPEKNEKTTKTVQKLDYSLDVPLVYPTWFFAAYPDVVAWAMALADSSHKDFVKVFDCASVEEFENLNLENAEGKFQNEFLRKLVDYYIQKINPILEVSEIAS